MSDIREVIEKTKEFSPKQRRDELRQFVNRRDIGSIFLMLNGGEVRSVLRALSDMCAIPAAKDIAVHYMDIHEKRISELLFSEDAKERKNCAELIGRVNPKKFENELLQALNHEKSFFVLPSIILAIGNIKTEAALKAIKGFEIPECDKKHMEAITAAKKKAVSSLKGVNIKPHINTLPDGTPLVLYCASKEVTRRELTALKIENKNCPFLMNSVIALGLKEYKDVFCAKTFYTAEIYVGSSKGEYEKPTAPLKNMLKALFGDEIQYRLELTSDFEISGEDRRDRTARFAAELDKDECFENSPSAYICTIHIHMNARGSHVLIEPSRELDKRFAYRKQAISASAHPATAAACVFFAKRYLSSSAKVLDCFCGAGTMLFARARFAYRELTGSDTAIEAIKAARANERVAKTGAHFLIKNATTPFNERYDEIICNMPFGLRVSNHDKNRFLYADFIKNLPSMLAQNGKAFLFTQEKELLVSLIEKSEELEIIDKHTFSAGGLYPSLYVLKIKEKK